MAEATARPLTLDGVSAALGRFPVHRRLHTMIRDIRFTLPLCLVLVCGSFAAAALTQMRLERNHTFAQAAAFEQARADDSARNVAGSLDRYAAMGAVFAAAPQQVRSAELVRAEPAIRDIAVFGGDGALLSHLNAASQTPFMPPPLAGPRGVWLSGTGMLAFRDGGRTIAVRFDPARLAAARTVLAAKAQAGDISAAVPGWPLAVIAGAGESDVPENWTEMLPVYLFVILGFVLAGGWLAALLTGAFTRNARTAGAIRALKATHPVEARLMVRLANAERGAVEALRAKSEFIAHMSHELRTPLNAVIGFSEVIADGLYGPAGHPKYGEYARDIGDAGRELHAKIGNILEFANIEAGRHPLKSEAVDLAALVQACVDEQQGRAFSRRIALSLAAGDPGAARADAGAVRRVLTNLLANALNYTGEGGWVRAAVHFEEGAGVVTITDSGMGFSRAERGRAGKPFARFDRPGAVTGTGLGLAIAMELARRMGGAMRLSSLAGKGATLELRLPRC